MTAGSLVQVGIYLLLVLLLVKPLGGYMARIYQGKRVALERVLGPVERAIYRLSGVHPEQEMGWRGYAFALLLFSAAGWLLLYLLLRTQGRLPLNPAGLRSVSPGLAFNIASSFISNTNWQSYGGETALSPLTQMVGLTVQNFASAAAGMSVLAALIRGLASQAVRTVGNFWVDLTRTTLYILLPLSLLLALALVSQGTVQTLEASRSVPLLQPVTTAGGEQVTQQVLALGPAASQVAIKQLGTNGGGFFNANAAHPFENPTPLSNLLEMLAILALPASLCHTFGKMVGDTRQGWAVLAAMGLVFLTLLGLTLGAEQHGNPLLSSLGVDQTASPLQAGGNMEGKELRFGIGISALWATATTAASNGSVNSMHDSYTPLGGLVPMVAMQLGEVVFGGVGSGLYGMLAFVIVGVFVAGLMVGRTPEYLGKKIEAFEVKMASLLILIVPVVVLGLTALAVVTSPGRAAILNPGPHGFSEVLYAYTSLGNNNGSAFAGLSADSPFYNITGGLAMLIGRFWLAVPTLALAGSLAAKKKVPAGAGTLPTHGPLFVGWLVVVVILVGALNFLPALALGPIVEHLMMGM
jgi:K+-transporting ATPase ATPase A chain